MRFGPELALSTHKDNAEIIRHDLKRLTRTIRWFALLTSERRRRGRRQWVCRRRLSPSRDPAARSAPRTTYLGAADTGGDSRSSPLLGCVSGGRRELILSGRKMTDTVINSGPPSAASAARAPDRAHDQQSARYDLGGSASGSARSRVHARSPQTAALRRRPLDRRRTG